jgi:hypothetical protein
MLRNYLKGIVMNDLYLMWEDYCLINNIPK